MTDKIILASASPRRRELLGIITENFEVIPSDAEEVVPKSISAEDTAEFLARIKAKSVGEKYAESTVIGADTCVIIENKILGKPKDKTDARQMIKLLSGRTHKVITGCAIAKGNKMTAFSVETEVEFYTLSDSEIEDYINTFEPYDKAGSYGIQGKASLFVKGIKGDYFNVVGLPIAELNRKLKGCRS